MTAICTEDKTDIGKKTSRGSTILKLDSIDLKWSAIFHKEEAIMSVETQRKVWKMFPPTEISSEKNWIEDGILCRCIEKDVCLLGAEHNCPILDGYSNKVFLGVSEIGWFDKLCC